MKAFLLPLLSVVLLTRATAAPVVLTATQDTDVYQYTTYPTSTTYSLGVNASGNAGHTQKSLVKFGVTTTSLGMTSAEIASAKLRLYVLPDATTGSGYGGILTPGGVSVFPQSTAWTVATARWSTFSTGALIGTMNVTQASTEQTPVWVELDVTALVKAWTAGTTVNNGFVLQSASETATPLVNVLFASLETGFPPQLVVTKMEPLPFRVTSFTMSGANVSLTWNSVVGKSYRVRESPDLVNWTTRQTLAATALTTSTTLTKTVYPAGRGFYRIELVP